MIYEDVVVQSTVYSLQCKTESSLIRDNDHKAYAPRVSIMNMDNCVSSKRQSGGRR